MTCGWQHLVPPINTLAHQIILTTIRFHLTIAILLLSGLPWASAQQFHVTNYTDANGLPSSSVRHVARDTFGFLWVATDDGLVRFDGRTFRAFAQRIPSQYGKYLLPTEDGLLLSHDAGVSRIRPGLDTSRITTFLAASIDAAAAELYYPERLFRQRDGTLWIGQADGTARRLRGDLARDYRIGTREDGAAPERHLYFAETVDGHLWVATATGGLYRYAAERDSFLRLAQFGPLRELQAHGEELWLGGRYLYRVVPTPDGLGLRSRQRYTTNPGEITALALDTKGNLFLGIRDRGLYYLDRRRGRDSTFIRVFGNNDPHRVNELPYRNIHSIVLEADDQLYVCAAEGLGILRKRFFESVGGLPNGGTAAIAVADSQRLYVNFGDLHVIQPTEIGFESRPFPVPTTETVAGLVSTPRQLWLGTSNGQLLGMDHAGKVLHRTDLSERGEGIFYLFSDRRRRLWICQAPTERPIVGVACLLPDGRLREYGVGAGLSNRILVLRETPQGRIYAGGIGRESYLYRYAPEGDNFINLSLPFDFYVSPNFEVHDLAIDTKGVVWLATTDGLLRHDMDRVQRIDLGPDYADVEVRAVVTMPDGTLWLSTDTKGILRYRRGETVSLQEESGLPAKVMEYRALVRDPLDRLWVGTAEGLVFSLERNPRPRPTPQPRLLGVTAGGEPLPGPETEARFGLPVTVRVTVPALHGYRTFFQYRTGPGEWSLPDTSRTATFAVLPVGTQRLQIRARQEGGYRWSPAREVVVEVYRPWYTQRRWWLTTLVLAIGFGLWWSRFRWKRYRHRIRSLHNELRQERDATRARDSALHEAEAVIRSEHNERRTELLTLEVLRRAFDRLEPGLSIAERFDRLVPELSRLPDLVAFAWGVRRDDEMHYIRYTVAPQERSMATLAFDPDTDPGAFSLVWTEPWQETAADRPAEEQPCDYAILLAIPFTVAEQPQVLMLYSDEEDGFDEHRTQAIRLLTTFLQQMR